MSHALHSHQDLNARRQELLLRSAQLREQLAQRAQVFQPALRAADKMRDGARWARRNPAWALLGATALAGMVAVRPRAALRLTMRAWTGWQLLRRAKPVLGTVFGALLGRR